MLKRFKLWIDKKYQRSLCAARGHYWSASKLSIKGATRGRSVLWECERCSLALQCNFPDLWDVEAYKEAVNDPIVGRYIKRLYRLRSVIAYLNRSKKEK